MEDNDNSKFNVLNIFTEPRIWDPELPVGLEYFWAKPMTEGAIVLCWTWFENRSTDDINTSIGLWYDGSGLEDKIEIYDTILIDVDAKPGKIIVLLNGGLMTGVKQQLTIYNERLELEKHVSQDSLIGRTVSFVNENCIYICDYGQIWQTWESLNLFDANRNGQCELYNAPFYISNESIPYIQYPYYYQLNYNNAHVLESELSTGKILRYITIVNQNMDVKFFKIITNDIRMRNCKFLVDKNHQIVMISQNLDWVQVYERETNLWFRSFSYGKKFQKIGIDFCFKLSSISIVEGSIMLADAFRAKVYYI